MFWGDTYSKALESTLVEPNSMRTQPIPYESHQTRPRIPRQAEPGIHTEARAWWGRPGPGPLPSQGDDPARLKPGR